MAEPINWSTLVRSEPWDGGRINVEVSDIGDPGFVELMLKTAPEITWWKGVLIFDQNGGYFGEIWTQDADHESDPARLSAEPAILDGWKIELAKAKMRPLPHWPPTPSVWPSRTAPLPPGTVLHSDRDA